MTASQALGCAHSGSCPIEIACARRFRQDQLPMESRRPHRKGILLLSAGSKVAIARIAQKAAQRRGLVLHASDCRENVPTRLAADAFVRLPAPSEPTWSETLLDYCERHAIGLVLPSRHGELAKLCELRLALEERGALISLSSEEAVALCINKLDTHSFLSKLDSPTPLTVARNRLAQSSLAGIFPLFAKPSSGAASIGAGLVGSQEELDRIPDDWVLQSVASGQEYTVNLYLTREGDPICVIPHERVAVEAGEVVQARTRRVQPLIDECVRVAKALPGAEGIINIQGFYDAETGETQIIEINPRIGGGYPLCDAANGTYIEWLCQEFLDGSRPTPFERWTENLLMMRYREGLYSL